MDPFHPLSNPANYGREHEGFERPDPAVNPNDFLWRDDPQRDYQEALRLSRINHDQTEHYHYGLQHYGGVADPSTNAVLRQQAASHEKRPMADSFALVELARQMGQCTIDRLTEVAAPTEIIKPGRLAFTEAKADELRAAIKLRHHREYPPREHRVDDTNVTLGLLDCGKLTTGPVDPIPPTEGWMVGRRIVGRHASVEQRLLRERELGYCQANVSLYLISKARPSISTGLYIGSSWYEPKRYTQYRYASSVGRLGLTVHGTRVSRLDYDREKESVESLKTDLRKLLGKYGLVDGLE